MCTAAPPPFIFGLDAKFGGSGLSRRERPKPDTSGLPERSAERSSIAEARIVSLLSEDNFK